MDLTNKTATSISIKEFKIALTYLRECFGIDDAVLANVGFAILEKGSKELTPYQISTFSLKALDDKSRICFYMFNNETHPLPLFKKDVAMELEDLTKLFHILWLVEYIYASTLAHDEGTETRRTMEYIEETQYNKTL